MKAKFSVACRCRRLTQITEDEASIILNIMRKSNSIFVPHNM